jgi:hypothetical protein
MQYFLRLLLCIALPSPSLAASVQHFEVGWESDASATETPRFNDSQWRGVTLPHDWAIRGVIVPQADETVAFPVWSPDAIAAVDSADNTSHEPFRPIRRRVYDGWYIAVIRGTGVGKIAVGALATGLAAGSVTIEIGAK